MRDVLRMNIPIKNHKLATWNAIIWLLPMCDGYALLSIVDSRSSVNLFTAIGLKNKCRVLSVWGGGGRGGGKPVYVSPPKRNVSLPNHLKASNFFVIIKKILSVYQFCFNNKKIGVTII